MQRHALIVEEFGVFGTSGQRGLQMNDRLLVPAGIAQCER